MECSNLQFAVPHALYKMHHERLPAKIIFKTTGKFDVYPARKPVRKEGRTFLITVRHAESFF